MEKGRSSDQFSSFLGTVIMDDWKEESIQTFYAIKLKGGAHGGPRNNEGPMRDG